MRLMSFSLTKDQIRARTKTVTRRLGWTGAKVGQRVVAVEKAMGLKKGEHPVKLATIEFTSVSRVRVFDVSGLDVTREGFPGMAHSLFVEMFCKHMGCSPTSWVTRIEFRYAEED